MRLLRLLIVCGVSSAMTFAAACTKSDTVPSATTASSCSVTLGSTATTVAAAGTTGTLAVTAASTCSWTAVSSATFLSITSGSSGTGNGTVAYSVAANTGSTDRSASISVNGTVSNFTQSGALVLAPAGCAVTATPATQKANSGGGTVNVTVTGAANCSWTATSNASFLTVPSGATTGSGTLVVTVAGNGGAARSGTVTVGGQTVTVTQDAGLTASFQLFDPGQTLGATNVCQFRAASGNSTTCTLRSNSFTGGANAIVNYAWTVQYTNGTVKSISSSGSASSLAITDQCGSTQATDDGALNPLDVTLVVTDNLGNTATAKAGSGGQPALQIQMFTCGK